MGLEGRYSVIKKVADGGMAEIFLATQTGAQGFARMVVVKRILPVFSMDPQFRNMIVDEAHIAMSLHHSNIVQVLDLGEADGRYFLVLDLVDGWDLATVLARGAAASFPLPTGLCLRIAAEVCRGLAYAHGQTRHGKPLGIVHRDMSPQNVLISEQGEVKLTDFGIAKALGKRERTQTGVIKGKLDFMSPEQALGREVDARSDIFSVGTVLYLMATGRRPFEGGELQTLLRIQNAEFPPPTEVCPALAPRVAAIIERAMRRDPAERYPSADQLMRDVEEVLRSDFASVGQSELKRYVEKLGRRDGIPPISRTPGLPVKDGGRGRSPKGDGMAEEETSPHGFDAAPLRASARGHVPSLALEDTRLDHGAPLANSVPDEPLPLPADTRTDYLASRRTRRPSPGRARPGRILGIALLLAGGTVGGFYALAPDETRKLLDDGRKRLARAGLSVPTGPETRPAAPAAERARAASGAPAPLARTGEKGSARRPESAQAPRREPSLGALEQPSAAAPPGRSSFEGGGGAKASLVTVRFATRPPRAIVRNSSGATLGTTPFALSLKPGTVQRLTFVKPGYASTSRNIAIGPTNQSFTVDLARARGGRR